MTKLTSLCTKLSKSLFENLIIYLKALKMQIYFCLQVWEPKSMKVHLSTSMKLLGKLYLTILLFLWTASIKNVDLADLRSRFRYREQKPSSNFDIFILIGLARRHNKVHCKYLQWNYSGNWTQFKSVHFTSICHIQSNVEVTVKKL